jgi:WW domain
MCGDSPAALADPDPVVTPISAAYVEPPPPADLEPIWERITDDMGRPYYVDHANKKSQWEAPPGLLPAPDVGLPPMPKVVSPPPRQESPPAPAPIQAAAKTPGPPSLSSNGSAPRKARPAPPAYEYLAVPTTPVSFPKKARSPFPPYDPAQITSPVQVDFTYRGKKKILSSVRLGKSGGSNVARSVASGWRRRINKAVEEESAASVSLNSYLLNEMQVQWFREEFDIHLKPNEGYWYDQRSGFFGKIGKQNTHTIDPCVPVFGDLHPMSSIGADGPASGVIVNGRSIDPLELAEFHRLGMDDLVEGQRYTVDPAGWVGTETEDGRPLAQRLFNWRQKLRASKSGRTRRPKPAPALQQHENSDGGPGGTSAAAPLGGNDDKDDNKVGITVNIELPGGDENSGGGEDPTEDETHEPEEADGSSCGEAPGEIYDPPPDYSHEHGSAPDSPEYETAPQEDNVLDDDFGEPPPYKQDEQDEYPIEEGEIDLEDDIPEEDAEDMFSPVNTIGDY